jgi:hypothetical protein
VEASLQVEAILMFARPRHFALVPPFCPQFQITCRRLP